RMPHGAAHAFKDASRRLRRWPPAILDRAAFRGLPVSVGGGGRQFVRRSAPVRPRLRRVETEGWAKKKGDGKGCASMLIGKADDDGQHMIEGDQRGFVDPAYDLAAFFARQT